MIRTYIALTAPPFTTGLSSVPTIQIWDESRTPEAHRAVMTHAHMLAAKLWSWNVSDWTINVEATADAGAQVTIETLRGTDAERQTALERMDDAVVALQISRRGETTRRIEGLAKQVRSLARTARKG